MQLCTEVHSSYATPSRYCMSSLRCRENRLNQTGSMLDIALVTPSCPTVALAKEEALAQEDVQLKIGY